MAVILMPVARKAKLFGRLASAVAGKPAPFSAATVERWYQWIARQQGQCWACLEQPGGCPLHDAQPDVYQDRAEPRGYISHAGQQLSGMF